MVTKVDDLLFYLFTVLTRMMQNLAKIITKNMNITKSAIIFINVYVYIENDHNI